MTIETLVEKLIDESIAVAVVGSAVWQSTNLQMIADWHIAAVGMVMMYYFGRKIRQSTK